MKTTASKNSQKVILKNIAEKINKSLSIFNYNEDKENQNRAIIKDEQIKVVPSEKTNFFSGSVMSTILETVNAYTKKYDNLFWGVDTKPVLKFDKNNEMYWIYAPQVVINFYNE